MLLGEVRLIQEVITSATAFSVSSPTVAIYDSAGVSVDSGAPTVTPGGSATTQTLLWDFTPAAIGQYTAVFTAVIGTETRAFTQRLEVTTPRGNGYPVGADLAAFLTAGNLTVSTALSPFLDQAAAAGVQAFEARAQRKMLAESSTTRTYNPPTDHDSLLFVDDMAAVPSAVVFQPYSGSPYTFVAGQDYVLEPANALAKGWPIRRIRFRRRWMESQLINDKQSIQATSWFGYALSLPDQARLGMLARGGWELHGLLAAVGAGALVSWKRQDVERTHGPDPLGYLRKVWAGDDGQGGQFGAAAAAFKRWEM